MAEINKIIGKKVLAIRGSESTTSGKHVEPRYILFDDGKTYMDLDEQDYYSYHDCATNARILWIYTDESMWNIIHSNIKKYPPANADI